MPNEFLLNVYGISTEMMINSPSTTLSNAILSRSHENYHAIRGNYHVIIIPPYAIIITCV